jgi:hypothetical protein
MKTVDDEECDTDDIEFQSGNYPIKECDMLLGPKTQFFAEELKPYIKKEIRECNDARRDSKSHALDQSGLHHFPKSELESETFVSE